MSRYDDIHEVDRVSIRNTKQWSKSSPLPENIGDMWMKFFNERKQQ